VLQSRRAHSRLLALLLFLSGSGPLIADAQRWAGPIPPKVTAQNGVLYLGGNRFTAPVTLAFAGNALAVNGMTLPDSTTTETLPETVPASPNMVRMNEMNVYMLLLAYRRHLDEGGLIICLRRRDILPPIKLASLLDGALPKLLAGRQLTPTEESQLRAWIPPDRWEEASRLQPLVLSAPMLNVR